MALSKVTYKLELPLSDLDPDQRDSAKEEIGTYLVEAILEKVGSAASPVSGYGKFKPLSPSYKEYKKKYSGSTKANLELKGDMLDALTFKDKGKIVEVGIWGKEAAKADGHCNFSGDSELPERRFIPNSDDDEKFKPDIRKKIAEILAEKSDKSKSYFLSKL